MINLLSNLLYNILNIIALNLYYCIILYNNEYHESGYV